MKKPSEIRNFALVGHAGSGKTSLAEALFHYHGLTPRLGRVDQGSAMLDFYDEEKEKKSTFTLKLASFTAQKDGLHYNLIDTPGYLDFAGDVVCGLHAVDSALLLVNATAGVEVGTEKYWEYIESLSLPRLLVVTQCAHEKAQDPLPQIQETFGSHVVAIQKVGSWGKDFGDLQWVWASDGDEKEALLEALADYSDELAEKYLEGEEIAEQEIRETLKAAFLEGKVAPVVFVDALAEKGIAELAEVIQWLLPSPQEARIPQCQNLEVSLKPEPTAPLTARVFKIVSEPHVGEIYFVRVYTGTLTAGSEVQNTTRKGTEKLSQIYRVLGKDRQEVPSLIAGDMGALVKLRNTRIGDTISDRGSECVLPEIPFPHPSIYEAVVPKSREDEQRFSEALTKIQMEDPSFQFHYEPELKQYLIYGLGEQHLTIIQNKMRKKFNVQVELQKPRIPYRETIRTKAEAIGKFVRQTGGRGQYGIAHLRIEPLGRGEGYEFVNAIFGGAIPQNFIPSVETGVKKAMEKGVLAGCPVVDVKVTLFDGKYHPVDSSNLAFEIAGSLGFKEAEKKAQPYLLEPIYEVEVVVPEEYMGDIMGDLNARRARILGTESQGKNVVIRAHVPLAEMYRYSNTLKSITRGRGTFSMRFSHYDEVPAHIAERIIPELRKERGVSDEED